MSLLWRCRLRCADVDVDWTDGSHIDYKQYRPSVWYLA